MYIRATLIIITVEKNISRFRSGCPSCRVLRPAARPNHNPRARRSSGSPQCMLVVHLPVIAESPPMDCLIADLVHRLFSTCAVAVGTTSNRVSSTKTSKTSGLSSTPASSVSLASSRLTSSGERLDMTSCSPLRVAPSDRGEPREIFSFQKNKNSSSPAKKVERRKRANQSPRTSRSQGLRRKAALFSHPSSHNTSRTSQVPTTNTKVKMAEPTKVRPCSVTLSRPVAPVAGSHARRSGPRWARLDKSSHRTVAGARLARFHSRSRVEDARFARRRVLYAVPLLARRPRTPRAASIPPSSALTRARRTAARRSETHHPLTLFCPVVLFQNRRRSPRRRPRSLPASPRRLSPRPSRRVARRVSRSRAPPTPPVSPASAPACSPPTATSSCSRLPWRA